LRIEAGLVNPPQRIKIGFLEWSDAKRHAAIVAGELRVPGCELRANRKVAAGWLEARGSKPAASGGIDSPFLHALFSSSGPLRTRIYKKYDF
jgi:hypothetical protein